jgi:hypothetical protein
VGVVCGLADLDFILMIRLRIVWRYCFFGEVLTIATDIEEDGGSQASSSAVYEGNLLMGYVKLQGGLREQLVGLSGVGQRISTGASNLWSSVRSPYSSKLC